MEYTEFKEDVSAICSESGLAVGVWICPTTEALKIMLHWADRIEEEEGVEVDSLINKNGEDYTLYISNVKGVRGILREENVQ